jgi:hypothetical protein
MRAKDFLCCDLRQGPRSVSFVFWNFFYSLHTPLGWKDSKREINRGEHLVAPGTEACKKPFGTVPLGMIPGPGSSCPEWTVPVTELYVPDINAFTRTSPRPSDVNDRHHGLPLSHRSLQTSFSSTSHCGRNLDTRRASVFPLCTAYHQR